MPPASTNSTSSKDLEAQQLIPHPVTPLNLADTWKAAKTCVDAFQNDPMTLYVRAGQKPSPSISRALYFATLTRWIRTKTVVTVNKGSSLLVATPVQIEPRPPAPPVDRLADFLLKWIMAKLRSPEQRKRVKEIDDKFKKLVSLVLGDRVEEMVYVDLLATEPQSQGQGFGTLLLEATTNHVDILGQATWLGSNVVNSIFYNTHGFKTVGEIYLGDDNPEWHQAPITIRLMVREPKKTLMLEKPSNIHQPVE